MDKAALNRAYFDTGDWLHTEYRGVPIFKYATDLWIYRQIIEDTKPDLIIETGTLKGGSAKFFSDIRFDDYNAHIVTIDIVDEVENKDIGIDYLIGDSLNQVIDCNWPGGSPKKTMVILDSDHTKDHVLAELKKYAPLVSKGCYLVVEDTFISQYLNNEDPNNDYSNGSAWEAVQEWDSTGFEVQPDMFTLSMNPGGWFKRV